MTVGGGRDRGLAGQTRPVRSERRPGPFHRLQRERAAPALPGQALFVSTQAELEVAAMTQTRARRRAGVDGSAWLLQP